MRLYFSFRGGDRPKNAEREFPEVCVTPKGAYEPWMLFRKPIAEKTVAENLRRWKAGGLRRLGPDRPLPDAIASGRTPEREEAVSDHPCLKPQHFMRIIVRALLPLGEGTVLDPFMGSGSTIAAADAIGYDAIGIELDKSYFQVAEHCIPQLAALYPDFTGENLTMNGRGQIASDDPQQMSLLLSEEPAPCNVAPRRAPPGVRASRR
jgi:site-specific DNA-methyltransferase (adenine-specific)